MIPYLVRTFNLHAETETMTILLRTFGCKSSSSVERLAIQGSLESGASVRAIFVTREHKLTNVTRVTSI